MQTKPFTYICRSVGSKGARLVAWYDKDYADRPAAVIIHGAQFNVGDEVKMSFVNSPASTQEILGN